MAEMNATGNQNYFNPSLRSSLTKQGGANGAPTSKKDNRELSTDAFFKLLAAQIQNQDMSSPMGNSEMMTQMTQIAMMQAINNFSVSMSDFSYINTLSYGTSMMGKEVVVAVEEKDGTIKEVTGQVTRVDIYSGIPEIYIGDDAKTGYPLASIMSIGKKGKEL